MKLLNTSARKYLMRSNEFFLHCALLFLLLLTLAPFALMLSISFKDQLQYNLNPIGLTFPFHFENYISALSVVAAPIAWTLLIGIIGVSLNILTSSLASYAFARHRFPGNTLLYYMIFGLMFVPPVVVLVPLFLWNQRLGLAGTGLGLIATYWIMGHCFSVFLLTSTFRALPEELMEAARCDGAGHLIIWWRVIMPLARPMIIALALIQMLWVYCNDYVWQLVMTGGTQYKTISVALSGLKQGFGGQQHQPGIEMAGYVLGSLPLVVCFLLASNAFVRGMTAGAIKG